MANLKTVLTLTLLLTGSMFAADVTGKWSGTTQGKSPDGETMHDSVWMALTRTGTAVTGTAGPAADRQTEIKEGKIDGDQVQFKVAVGDATAVVRLKLEGDNLKGAAEVETPDGKMVVNLDLKRVP